MAKRVLTQKEKDRRLKKFFKMFFIAFLILSACAIAVGVGAVKISEYREKQAFLKNITENDIEKKLLEQYREDPWEGENALDTENILLSKEMTPYYTALRSLEMHAAYYGTNGYEFDASAGNTFCLDTENIPQSVLPAVKKMYEDYSKSKGFTFKAATMAQLKEQGVIDEERQNAYTEGVFVRPGELREVTEGIYSADIEIYYSYMNLRIPEVILISDGAFAEYEEYYFEDYKAVEKSGNWTRYEKKNAGNYSDEKLLFRYDGWRAYVEPGLTA